MKTLILITTILLSLMFGVIAHIQFIEQCNNATLSVILEDHKAMEEVRYAARLDRFLAGERYETRVKELKEERTCLIQEGCIGVREVSHP